MLREVMAETGAGFKASMSALRDALESGLDNSSAVASASERIASCARAGEVDEAKVRSGESNTRSEATRRCEYFSFPAPLRCEYPGTSLKHSFFLQLRLSRLDERMSSWNEGDEVAALSQGEYWQAKIVKVMERRSGTMFRVRFSDGSEQVVDTDSVKPKSDDDDDGNG